MRKWLSSPLRSQKCPSWTATEHCIELRQELTVKARIFLTLSYWRGNSGVTTLPASGQKDFLTKVSSEGHPAFRCVPDLALRRGACAGDAVQRTALRDTVGSI